MIMLSPTEHTFKEYDIILVLLSYFVSTLDWNFFQIELIVHIHIWTILFYYIQTLNICHLIEISFIKYAVAICQVFKEKEVGMLSK